MSEDERLNELVQAQIAVIHCALIALFRTHPYPDILRAAFAQECEPDLAAALASAAPDEVIAIANAARQALDDATQRPLLQFDAKPRDP